MKKKNIIQTLICTFLLLVLCTGTVFAQEDDDDSSGTEQLLILLRALVQVLEENSTDSGAEDVTVEPTAEADPFAIETEPAAEEPVFQSYTNKKLIIGKMPESYFIRKDERGEDGNNTSNENETEKIPTCPPGAEYDCFVDLTTGKTECGCWFG